MAPVVVFVQPDGVEVPVEANIGDSVMITAVDHGVDGIVAECGGNAMCATCHVFVDPDWIERLPDREPDEEELLDTTAVPRGDTSRLSCQIAMSDALDGLRVQLPATQV